MKEREIRDRIRELRRQIRKIYTEYSVPYYQEEELMRLHKELSQLVASLPEASDDE